MEVVATTKYARIAPGKLRDLARRITGLSVNEALQVTGFNPRKGAFLLGKTLKSAVANAENNAKLSVDALRVKEAVVDEGPALKRYWPRARGMVSHIRRRTSHIRVTLTDR
ncbi:MAG: 50S ribosomal protein L22 [Lentisphaerae bacterium]|nr:50S ribosomal protein L22 [Lentisphaerota bacterium]